MYCPVCLERLRNGSTVRLSCHPQHYICRSCLTQQLTGGYNAIQQGLSAGNYDKCPLCRMSIMTTSGLGSLDDYVNGTLANLVIISIPGRGLGEPLLATDLT